MSQFAFATTKGMFSKHLEVPTGGDKHKVGKMSPSLKELQAGPPRVKRMTQLYEGKTTFDSKKTNWWLEEKTKKSR